MAFVLQSVIAKELQVIKHHPLHTIATYAVPDELEDVLGVLHKLRIGEVQVGPTVLLGLPSFDYRNLKFIELLLGLIRPWGGDGVFPSRYHRHPFASEARLSHF